MYMSARKVILGRLKTKWKLDFHVHMIFYQFKDVSSQITICPSPDNAKTGPGSVESRLERMKFRPKERSQNHVAKQVAVPYYPVSGEEVSGDRFCSLLGW